jgi:hypothetical protein
MILDQIKFRSYKKWSYKIKDHAIFDLKSWSEIIDLRSSEVWDMFRNILGHISILLKIYFKLYKVGLDLPLEPALQSQSGLKIDLYFLGHNS